jgi:putative cell wall-binding protein
VACSLLLAGRRSVVSAVVVVMAGMALVTATPNAEAVGGPVLTVLSASRICPDSSGFFHLDVTVTGDAPNATRTLLANIGQNYPIATEPGLDTNSAGTLPLTSVVLANQLDVQVLTDPTVTIDLVAYGDPSQRVLAHTTIVVPACTGPIVETVSCTDHSQALGSPACVGAPDTNYSQYVQVVGGLGTAAEENSYSYTARPAYEVLGATALVDDTVADQMNGDGSTPDPNHAGPAPLGPGDRVIDGNSVLGTVGTYIYQLTVSIAVYPGSVTGPWTSAPPAPTATRVFGADRMATAVAISTIEYPGGGAGAVVLARADAYPDALVGAPLAASSNAPLLLTSGAALPDATKGELQRVLAQGKTVYLLGGTASIPDSVSTELTSLGYVVVRYGGVDRYGTAVAVADALNDPATVLLASGLNFPDALTAGPAAASMHGAVLLTDGTHLPASISAYLSAHATTTYAIGGAAATADPSGVAIVGADRYATAASVAQRFFRNPKFVGIAVGSNFPDALAAGAYLAHSNAPLLLTGAGDLSSPTKALLVSVRPAGVDVFGGPSVIADSVVAAANAAISITVATG